MTRSVFPDNPIHPVDVSKATSPYARKLANLREQFNLILAVAPESDRAELLLIVSMLEQLG